MKMSACIRGLVAAALFLGAGTSAGAFAQGSPEGRTVEINGMKMYYEVVGEGDPLVLLHAGMETGRMFTPIVDRFSGQYRLIIPDLRGHGRSTNPTDEFTMRQSARDVFSLLDHLEIDRFKGIGTSAGAMTLLHMATGQPDRVVAMVLVGSGSYFPGDCRRQLGQLSAESYPEAGWNRLRELHRHGDAQIRSLFDTLSALAESYDDMTFTPPHLATITASTLVVHGDRDYCFPVSMAEEIYSSIPKAYLWVVPKGSHVPIFGPQRDVFTETALIFLGGGWKENGPGLRLTE